MSEEIKKEITCNNCIKFNTCKFIEKNKSFSKEMYGMFEYAEWNNLDKLFYNNASKCRYYVDNSVNIEGLLNREKKVKNDLHYLNNYINNNKERLESEFILDHISKTIKEYIK